MTKMQRVLATLKKEETDRVPFSAYTPRENILALKQAVGV